MKDLNRIIESLGSSGVLSGLAGGMAGGVLSGALMSKGGRKLGKTALKVGALAAVGGIAWKAYQHYQGKTAPQAETAAPALTGLTSERFIAAAEDRPDNPGPLLLLRAMIAAAHADGHIDAAERQRIFERVEELELDSDAKAMLFDELQSPLNPSALAALIPDQETAVEVYVSSVLAIDTSQPMSRHYLEGLASRLQLPAELVQAVHVEADIEGHFARA